MASPWTVWPCDSHTHESMVPRWHDTQRACLLASGSRIVGACDFVAQRADQVAVSDGDYEGAEETMALGSPEELSHPERLPEPKQREPPPPDTNNCMDLPLDKDFTQVRAPRAEDAS